MTTKIILSRDVANLGAAGEVVEVKDGYARNYLVPRGYAVRWTKGAQRSIDETLEAARKRDIASVEHATALRDQIAANPVVVIEKKAGENGRLFGAVTAREVASALSEALGSQLDARQITFDSVKKTGTYPASIRLRGDLTANFDVVVKAA